MVEKNVRNDQWVKDMAKKVITRILVPLSFESEVLDNHNVKNGGIRNRNRNDNKVIRIVILFRLIC